MALTHKVRTLFSIFVLICVDERATKPQPEPEQPSQQQPSQEEEKQEAKYLNDSFEESEWDGAPIGKCGDLVYKFTVNNST